MTLPVLLGLALAPLARAKPPCDVQLNPAESSISATLTILGVASTDTSPITGTMRVRLNAAVAPSSIALHDFSFNATDPLDFSIVFYNGAVPVGLITAQGTNVGVDYANPGTPLGPVPIMASNFGFANVPTDPRGTTNYTASGTACILMQIQAPPVPCTGIMDFADTGTQSAAAMPGTITLNGRTATVAGSISIAGPLDPANPSFGTLAISGAFRGTCQVPYCPGDFDQNDAVAVADIFAFLSAWFAGLPSADMNGNNAADVPDIFMFLSAWFAPC